MPAHVLLNYKTLSNCVNGQNRSIMMHMYMTLCEGWSNKTGL